MELIFLLMFAEFPYTLRKIPYTVRKIAHFWTLYGQFATGFRKLKKNLAISLKAYFRCSFRLKKKLG